MGLFKGNYILGVYYSLQPSILRQLSSIPAVRWILKVSADRSVLFFMLKSRTMTPCQVCCLLREPRKRRSNGSRVGSPILRKDEVLSAAKAGCAVCGLLRDIVSLH